MEFTLNPADPTFGYIDELPVVCEEFGGLLRWHVDKEDVKNASGALYSVDTGRLNRETGRAEFNLVSRVPDTLVLVLHMKREFASPESMMLHILACVKISDQVGSRTRGLVVRGSNSPVEQPYTVRVQKLAAKYFFIAMSEAGFLSSSARFAERAFVRTILFFVKFAIHSVHVSFLEEPNGVRLWVENPTEISSRVPTGGELLRARQGLRKEIDFWIASCGYTEDVSFLDCPLSHSSENSVGFKLSGGLEKVTEDSLELLNE